VKAATPAAGPVAASAEDFGRILAMAAHEWRLALDRRLRPLGLSRATWMLLVYVRKLDSPSQTDLADALGIEDPSIVRLVDRLAADDLVERRVGADRRVRTIHLTPRGEALSAEIWRVAGHLRKELLRDIPLVEIEAALGLLERLRARLAGLR
jgi:MarR family transcriptional regulator for hemolysin